MVQHEWSYRVNVCRKATFENDTARPSMLPGKHRVLIVFDRLS